jgi:hypothetical protein
MVTPNELQDEERRLRRARLTVDVIANLIMQGALARGEAERLVGMARRRVLELFPGQDQTFDLLYAPRFRRLVDEFTTRDADRPHGPAVVLPFRPRWP